MNINTCFIFHECINLTWPLFEVIRCIKYQIFMGPNWTRKGIVKLNTPVFRRKISTNRPRLPKKIHTFDAFQSVAYRYFWASVATFSGSFWLEQVVMGWLAYQITNSALLTSIAMGLGAMPILLGAPLGGLISERFKKKPLLMGIYAYQTTLVVIFATLVMTDNASTWTIFAYIFLMGMIWTIHDPTRMSLLTSIIPRKSILNAMALNSLAFSIMRLVMPALGGLLLAYVGPGPLFIGQALLILCTALTVLLMKNNESTEKQLDNKSFQRVIPELKKGIEHIAQQPVIVVLLILNILMMVSIVPFISGLMPVYAAEVFYVGPKGLGLLISGAGFGSLIGTTILASVGNIKNPIRIAFLIIGIMALLMLCITFIDSYPLALTFIMVFSGLLMCYFSIASSTVQGILEDRFRGRVTGIYMMATGLMPLGSLIAGSIANTLGAQFATGVGAASSLIALAIIFIAFRPLWHFTNEIDSPSPEPLDEINKPQPSISTIPATVNES